MTPGRRPDTVSRHLVRLDRGCGFTLKEACEYFPKENAQAVRARLLGLEAEGLLRRDGPRRWRATQVGVEYQTASRPLLHRDTADRMVEALRQRIYRVNESEQLAFRVRVAVLFGSYLSKAPMIGDIDVAIELKARLRNLDKQFALQLAAESRLEGARTTLEVVTFPIREVMNALRGRARIDLRQLSELERLIEEKATRGTRVATRVLFGKWRYPTGVPKNRGEREG